MTDIHIARYPTDEGHEAFCKEAMEPEEEINPDDYDDESLRDIPICTACMSAMLNALIDMAAEVTKSAVAAANAVTDAAVAANATSRAILDAHKAAQTASDALYDTSQAAHAASQAASSEVKTAHAAANAAHDEFNAAAQAGSETDALYAVYEAAFDEYEAAYAAAKVAHNTADVALSDALAVETAAVAMRDTIKADSAVSDAVLHALEVAGEAAKHAVDAQEATLYTAQGLGRFITDILRS